MQLILSRPGVQDILLCREVSSYVQNNDPATLLAGFAYVTLAGVTCLLYGLKSTSWENINKQFIIGINQGITEPGAIRRLLSEPNTRVRMLIPGKKLTKAALFDTRLFHPKVMLLETKNGQGRSLLSVGSANLTGRAMGPNVNNYECTQITIFDRTTAKTKSVDRFRAWWDLIWAEALPVDEVLLTKYADLRIESFSKNPDLLQLTEPAPTIGDAQSLWIEVGAGSGIQRHQVEFPFSLASFFGRPANKRVNLTLTSKTREWQGRPFTHKKTSYGVDIWRLGTPTINMGGESIQNRVLRFTRTSSPLKFGFEVADSGSAKTKGWIRDCSRLGHLGRTAGARSRSFGYI